MPKSIQFFQRSDSPDIQLLESVFWKVLNRRVPKGQRVLVLAIMKTECPTDEDKRNLIREILEGENPTEANLTHFFNFFINQLLNSEDFAAMQQEYIQEKAAAERRRSNKNETEDSVNSSIKFT